jgi:hypothetical protein
MTNSKPALTAPGGNAAPEAVQQATTVRVLPQGAGRIFTGATDDAAAEPEARFPTYARGDMFTAERAIAEVLEARGLVEIQP